MIFPAPPLEDISRKNNVDKDDDDEMLNTTTATATTLSSTDKHHKILKNSALALTFFPKTPLDPTYDWHPFHLLSWSCSSCVTVQPQIALECKKKEAVAELMEEPCWRVYYNGRKCGYTINKRECGDEEWYVPKAVEAIMMSVGELPVVVRKGNEAGGSESNGELMYMRENFERVVGYKETRERRRGDRGDWSDVGHGGEGRGGDEGEYDF